MSKRSVLLRSIVVSCLLITSIAITSESAFAAQRRGRGCRNRCERERENCHRHHGRRCDVRYDQCVRNCR